MGHVVITVQLHKNLIRPSRLGATSKMVKGGILWAFWKGPLLLHRKQVQQRGRRALQQMYKFLSFEWDMGPTVRLGLYYGLSIYSNHILCPTGPDEGSTAFVSSDELLDLRLQPRGAHQSTFGIFCFESVPIPDHNLDKAVWQVSI